MPTVLDLGGILIHNFHRCCHGSLSLMVRRLSINLAGYWSCFYYRAVPPCPRVKGTATDSTVASGSRACAFVLDPPSVRNGHTHSNTPRPTEIQIYTGVWLSQSRCSPRSPPPDDMYTVPARVVFFLLFVSSLVTAVNFTQCLEDFRNDPNATGGVDYRGLPTSPAQAAGFTYKTCTARCGRDHEVFMWKEFAHSWLPPWVALISQLPFGSGNHVDDFVSSQFSSYLTDCSAAHPTTLPPAISCH